MSKDKEVVDSVVDAVADATKATAKKAIDLSGYVSDRVYEGVCPLSETQAAKLAKRVAGETVETAEEIAEAGAKVAKSIFGAIKDAIKK